MPVLSKKKQKPFSSGKKNDFVKNVNYRTLKNKLNVIIFNYSLLQSKE